MATTWRDLLLDQLDFYWNFHLQPRLKGLTDDEYLWEPVDGAWSLREDDDGIVRIESVVPEPPVAPVTSIAWRMAHVGRDVLGKRARAFFGGSDAPEDASMFDDRHWPEPLPLTAEGGVALLDQGYTLWHNAIAALDDDALLRHPRQHAVSLVYVVPVDGECQPTQEALDLAWFTPAEVMSPSVITQMTGGQDRLLRLALAHVGQLP